MPNPAAELFVIFTDWRRAQGGSNQARRDLVDDDQDALALHIRAMELLSRIGREIDELERSGRRVASYRRAYPKWIRGTLGISTGSWGGATDAARDFGRPEMDALDTLADILDQSGTSRIDHTSRSDALQLLREVLMAVDNDDELDDRLRKHIRRVIRNLQACIEDFDSTDEDGMFALDAVWAAMQAAAASSSDPTKWEKFRDKFVYQAVVGWVAAAPSTILAITAT